jgi:hypothetical protein
LANPTAILNAMKAPTVGAQGSGQMTAISPLLGSYNSWIGGRQMGPELPRPIQDFLAGAFGPLNPLNPMPIDEPGRDGARPEPRRWQYPVGWNLPVGQPGTEGLKLASFAALRRYADVYSVVRTMINIRKDEISGTEWDIGPTKDVAAQTKGDKGAAKDQRERALKIVNFFKHVDPDYDSFQSWMGALMEELFVIDAMSVYVHPTRVDGKGPFGSSLAALEALNGETIRPLVDIRGSRPRPPAPAYQQYLWGVPRSDMMAILTGTDLDEMDDRLADEGISLDNPAEEYKGDQLLYMPYTKRVWTPYGFSPIEQAILPITLGLNRQAFLLDYFQEGTIPGVYVVAGDAYVTPTQQRQLQDSLNALAGDIAWKHRVIVLPPGSKTDPQKDLAWAKDVDQTVIEQVAMILHIQPHEIGMVPGGRTSGLGGKGMAEQQAAAVEKTRALPMLKWVKTTLFDRVIQDFFGQTDLEFKWVGWDEEEDQDAEATRVATQIAGGTKTIDQARIDRGEDPFNLPLTQVPVLISGAAIIPLDPKVPAPPPPAAPGGVPGQPGGLNANDPAGSALAQASMPTQGNPEKPSVNPLANLAHEKKGKRKKARKELVGRFEANLKDQSDQIAEAAKEREDKLPGKGKDDKKDKVVESSPTLEALGYKGAITVANLLKWRIKYKDGKLPKIVHDYLLRSYPKDVVEWSLDPDGEWSYEPHVALKDIDMGRRPGGRDPAKVEKIAKSLSNGASMDPIVLYDTGDGLGVADGYHRTLGADKAGWKDIPAFIGKGFDKYADLIDGPMQNESDSKKKAAYAELAVLRRFLRKPTNKVENFRTSAIDSDVLRMIESEITKLDTQHNRDAAFDAARRWIAKGGNPEGLRNWYNEGADGQIDWGSDGDFMQCVTVASEHMDEDDAKGFCNLRHQDAVGGAPGTEKTISLSTPLATGLVPYDLAGQSAPCARCGKSTVNGECPDHGRDQGVPGVTKYDESQPRDNYGKWTSDGDLKDLSDANHPGRKTVEALMRGEKPNIGPDQVKSLMKYALNHKFDKPLDIDNVRVHGTRQFGQDGLGIKREDMPQIPVERVQEYFKWLKDEYGVDVAKVSVYPQTLQPSQSEISVERTAKMYEMLKDGTAGDATIMISRDDYILDGHHRWAGATALSFEDPSVKMDAYQIDMNIKPLIAAANKWDQEVGIAHAQLTIRPDMTKAALLSAIDQELLRRGVDPSSL